VHSPRGKIDEFSIYWVYFFSFRQIMSGFVTQFYHCLQHVSLTVTGEISLFRSHKKNRNSIHKKRFSSAQCNHILWWPGSAQTRWRSLQHSRKPLSWILRGLLRLLRKGESREGGGIKRREERRGMEGRGREGEGSGGRR